MRIWITGCARTGTTLLRRLFYAFENTEVVNYEISLEDFIACRPSSGALVAKRSKESLLSYELSPREEKVALALMIEHDLQNVNMLRDGRDVIETQTNAIPERWLASMDAYWRLKEQVALSVCYEQLVREPDIVQADIAEQFGLVSATKFSDYPSFVPDAGFQEVPRYPPRPIDDKRVNKDYDWRSLVCPGLQTRFKAACSKYQELLEGKR